MSVKIHAGNAGEKIAMTRMYVKSAGNARKRKKEMVVRNARSYAKGAGNVKMKIVMRKRFAVNVLIVKKGYGERLRRKDATRDVKNVINVKKKKEKKHVVEKKYAGNVMNAGKRKKGIYAMMFAGMSAGRALMRCAVVIVKGAGNVKRRVRIVSLNVRIAGNVMRTNAEARNSVKAVKNAKKEYG